MTSPDFYHFVRSAPRHTAVTFDAVGAHPIGRFLLTSGDDLSKVAGTRIGSSPSADANRSQPIITAPISRAPAMDQNFPPPPNQSVNVIGDNNTVIIAGGNVQTTGLPHVDPAESAEGGASAAGGAVPKSDRRTPKRHWSRRPGGKTSVGTMFAVALLSWLVIASSHTTSPADWPGGKTAMCNDGWFSSSHTRSGTCSSHGGVLEWRYPASHPIWRQRESSSLALAR